jgi:hypothetical protein
MKGCVSMELNTCVHCILSTDQYQVQLVGQPYPAPPHSWKMLCECDKGGRSGMIEE